MYCPWLLCDLSDMVSYTIFINKQTCNISWLNSHKNNEKKHGWKNSQRKQPNKVFWCVNKKLEHFLCHDRPIYVPQKKPKDLIPRLTHLTQVVECLLFFVVR